MIKAEQIISNLTKTLVLSGMYKDEHAAIKDIAVTHIQKKIDNYRTVVTTLQKKYHKDFDDFTNDIRDRATVELEDDWMEWKGAIEMKNAWSDALREVINSDRSCNR